MPAGRPLQYETVEEMESIIDDYFNKEVDGGAWMDIGDAKIYSPTMSGLAYELDLSRQGLLNYANKDEFIDTIKRARAKVEIHLEQRLGGNAVTGTIFNLKNNFDWKDKQETEHSGTIGVTDLSDDALNERIAELEKLQDEQSG